MLPGGNREIVGTRPGTFQVPGDYPSFQHPQESGDRASATEDQFDERGVCSLPFVGEI
jgi:hypothetical protein